MINPPAGPAVLGIDLGRRWTAAVVRAGDRALHGWTLGPRDARGAPAPLHDPYDLAAWARYHGRIRDAVDQTLHRRPDHWGPCEARRGERDHERAAYDIAGAGPRILRARAEEHATGPSA
ncbi:hypothetical protein [Nonomuraea typhae]|uniref:hypothetical protein n=1 Tax=Nonomuraea typhae TaxID=2603600 RepID=UPI0012FB766B|nr:hypothetical protein [Nonomuraea typhae]